MAISPPSDLIMDVARAADPRRAQAATEKLAAVSSNPSDPAFASLVGSKTATPQSNAMASLSGLGGRIEHSSVMRGLSRNAMSTAQKSQSGAVADAYRALGGLLTQKMIEQSLPHGSDATFSKGVAGDAWKSMLAEHMANAAAPGLFSLPKTTDNEQVSEANGDPLTTAGLKSA